MNLFTKKGFALLFCVALLAGCAHENIEKKSEKAEPKAHRFAPTALEFQDSADRLIQNAPGLTDSQKILLNDLRDSTRVQLRDYNASIRELRTSLLKELLYAPSSARRKEMSRIRTKLNKVEDAKLQLLSKAVEKARSILGLKFSANRPLVSTLWGEHAEP